METPSSSVFSAETRSCSTLPVCCCTAPRSAVCSGHSLLEVCIAVLLSTILVGGAAQGIESAMAARVMEGAAAEFAMNIRYAQSQALALNRNVTIAFQDSSAHADACYVLYAGTGGSCTCSTTGAPTCTEGSTPLKSVVVPRTHGVSAAANVPRMQVERNRGLITPAGAWSLATASGMELRQTVNIAGRIRTCGSGFTLTGAAPC